MTHRVFVYGSLMKGFGNHGLLQDSAFVSPASIKGYSLYSLGAFPAAVRGLGQSTILGEVYEVDDATLARLDRLEGHPTFYERQQVTAYVDNMNGLLDVLFYHYQGDVNSLTRVADGSWRNYHGTSD